MKSKDELFNMPIVELREYMNSLSNPEIQEVAKIFEEDDIERDLLELLTASKLFDYMKYANGAVDIEFQFLHITDYDINSTDYDIKPTAVLLILKFRRQEKARYLQFRTEVKLNIKKNVQDAN